MRRLGEAILRGRAVRPVLDVLALDLDGEAAVAADEVVMVGLGGAGAVERLAVGALQ